MFIGIVCIMNSVAIVILWLYCDNLTKMIDILHDEVDSTVKHSIASSENQLLMIERIHNYLETVERINNCHTSEDLQKVKRYLEESTLKQNNLDKNVKRRGLKDV